MRNGPLASPASNLLLSLLLSTTGALGTVSAIAQTPSAPPAAPAAEPAAEDAPPPRGEVIIESHGQPPDADRETPAAGVATAGMQPRAESDAAKVELTDADRSALLITAYDLDARLAPATSGLSVRARLTVRNSGTAPLRQLALQVSSTLHWDSATLVAGTQRTHLLLAQHRLDTDADHTGAETEAILPLPAPLQPGASVGLDLFYSGTVAQSGGRLQRLGADAAQQQATDWDAISAKWTGLRGFGDVLWYPATSPQLFLAEGNTLFEAIGHTRLREENATVRLRLSVSYTGEAPAAAYFCGRRETLTAVPDDPDAAVSNGAGVATAVFAEQTLGFRAMSLFLLPEPETLLDATGSGSADPPDATGVADASEDQGSSSSLDPQPPPAASSATQLPAGSSAEGKAAGAAAPGAERPPDSPFLAIESQDKGAVAGFDAAARRVAPLLREWLGPEPLSALTVLDHDGQPFQDGPLLVAPMAVLATSADTHALLQSLTHAWIQTGQPWMDEGLAEFFALLWTEREAGHDAAVAELTELMRPVGLAEPDPANAVGSAGEPLTEATEEMFYRRKAGAVWWMLRGIVGDGNLHAALAAWRVQPVSRASPQAQALAFEHLLERLSGQQLAWFFRDWVLQDKGLPDLNIRDVAVVEEPAGTGHPAGWLVAVTVQNQGGAVAEVPLIVRSGINQTLRRLRIPAQTTVTERVLVENAPTAVVVNDGSTPELRNATHTRAVSLRTR